MPMRTEETGGAHSIMAAMKKLLTFLNGRQGITYGSEPQPKWNAAHGNEHMCDTPSNVPDLPTTADAKRHPPES